MKMSTIFPWMVVGCISIIVAIRTAQAVPLYPSDFENSRPVVDLEDPEVALEILTRLGQNILRARHEAAAASNSKRGLDLGLGRGFSGSQAAKHIMGLAAAKFSNGPGKRKRTEIALDYPSSPGMDVPPVSMNSGNDW